MLLCAVPGPCFDRACLAHPAAVLIPWSSPCADAGLCRVQVKSVCGCAQASRPGERFTGAATSCEGRRSQCPAHAPARSCQAKRARVPGARFVAAYVALAAAGPKGA